jgi:hypothetical protein
MFCSFCGERLEGAGDRCGACGSPAERPASAPASRPPPLSRVSMCPGCGYLGDGMPYFRRSSHAALLVGAALLTYGIGGLIYWLVKRDALVCPSCGLSWDRARAPDIAPFLGDSDPLGRAGARLSQMPQEPIPRGGLARRAAGVLLSILALFLLGVGVLEANGALVVASVSIGLVGASSFAWGWRALHRRREGLLRSLQTRVLHVAAARSGRITATDVASDLGVTLLAAERVLFSLDDGFRVRSDVTDEGLLIFDFPEIRVRNLSTGEGSPPSDIRRDPSPRQDSKEVG